MRYNKTTEEKIDRNYTQESGLLHRLVVWLFRSHVNRVCKSVLARAHERGLVESGVMHDLAGIVDRTLWPKRGLGRQPDNS